MNILSSQYSNAKDNYSLRNSSKEIKNTIVNEGDSYILETKYVCQPLAF